MPPARLFQFWYGEKIMKNKQKGAALVELALILPLLLLLTFITTEFGRAMFEYNAITKSTRDAVRYLSFQTPGTQITEARNLMVYGNLAARVRPWSEVLPWPMCLRTVAVPGRSRAPTR